MNAAEFDAQLSRMLKHFLSPADVEAESVELFKVVGHYHVDALEAAISDLIATAQDRFWPAPGKVKAAITARLSRYDKTSTKCEKCKGTTWVESWPWWMHKRVYVGFDRCDACGVPAPNYKAPQGRVPLTKAEYVQWQAGELKEESVPLSKPDRDVLTALQALRVLPSKAQRFVKVDMPEARSAKEIA